MRETINENSRQIAKMSKELAMIRLINAGAKDGMGSSDIELALGLSWGDVEQAIKIGKFLGMDK